MVFDQVRWGEVNRARETAWCGSGKVLNAGMAVHRLGGPSLTLAPLGGSPLGEIDREFAALGVPRRWIETAAATRVCTTILDRSTGRITELVENGRPLDRRANWAPSAPPMSKRLPGPRLSSSSVRCPPGAPGFALSRSGRLHALSAGPRFPRRWPALGPRFQTLRRETQSRGVGAYLRPIAGQRRRPAGRDAGVESPGGPMGGRYARVARPFGSAPRPMSIVSRRPRSPRSSIRSAAATAWPPASPGRPAGATRSSTPCEWASAPRLIILAPYCPGDWRRPVWKTG